VQLYFCRGVFLSGSCRLSDVDFLPDQMEKLRWLFLRNQGGAAQPSRANAHLSVEYFLLQVNDCTGIVTNQRAKMNIHIDKFKRVGGLFVALGFFIVASVSAQQIPQAVVHNMGNNAYDVARESVISGKILQYSGASNTGPAGAHISLQTSSGTVDVHAGNAKLITASHLALQAGDSVSITGENVTVGDKSVFVARVIQKGNQSVAVRSANGMPLRPTARSVDGRMIAPGGIR